MPIRRRRRPDLTDVIAARMGELEGSLLDLLAQDLAVDDGVQEIDALNAAIEDRAAREIAAAATPPPGIYFVLSSLS
jgi:hypothetical protein